MTTKDEARAALLELCPPGTVVYNVLEHVSASGMTRWIKSYVVHDGDIRWLSGHIRNLLGEKRHARYDGVTMGGCGMDMGFALVYDLSHRLYGDGYALKDRWL